MQKFCTKLRNKHKLIRELYLTKEAVKLLKPCFFTVLSVLCAFIMLVSEETNTDPYGTFRTYAPMTENIVMAFFLVFAGTLFFDYIVRNIKR